MTDKTPEERLKTGIKHFRSLKPSDWNGNAFVHLQVFLNLVEAYVNGEKVHANDLQEDIPFEEAKEILT